LKFKYKSFFLNNSIKKYICTDSETQENKNTSKR
jgi:hypothetical protein